MTGEIFKQIYGLLKEKPILFWDFDGVIKDSVPVKSKAYESELQGKVNSFRCNPYLRYFSADHH